MSKISVRGAILCAVLNASVFLFGHGIALAEQEKLPGERDGEYSFYLSEERPYLRLSPHRSETVDAEGKTQPRRISALYSLADLRVFGGEKWDAKTGGCSPAYSLTPHVTAPSGTRYAMVSPEQTLLDAAATAQLRAIVAVSYPFCTAEKMRAFLAENGVLTEQNGIIAAGENFTAGIASETISESELLSAVQTAIWRIAGKTGSITKVYTDTRAAGRIARTLEPDPYDGADAALAHTANNIRVVSDYLCSLSTSTEADMPLTAMTVSATLEEDTNHITLRIRPNGTINADDSLVLEVGETAYALFSENGTLPVLQPDADGVYTLQLNAVKENTSLAIHLRGTQHTAKDICLYCPSSGDVMQSLVGAFGGTVDVSLTDALKTEELNDRARLRCMTELHKDGPRIPLAGATFSLYLSDASQGMTCVAENLVTDHEGIIDVQHLRPPKDGERYLFVPMTVPKNYAMPADVQIHADSAAAVQVLISPVFAAAVSLALTDDEGTGISDIPFALYRDLGGSETVLLSEYRTDSLGELTVLDLPAGEYRFEQLAVPEGFAAETKTHAFSVTEGNADVEISAKNLAYRSIEGQVCFVDCDAPASAQVLLLRDGVVCAEQTVSASTDWRFVFSDVPVTGEYTLAQEPVAGCVTEISEGKIINRPRTCDVVLRQTVQGRTLTSGSVFSLHRTTDGGHVCTTAADRAGTIKFSALPMGSYILRERRAPAGIRAMKETLYLVIGDSNTAMDGDLPLTAALQDAEGNVFDGLTIARRRKIFFGLGLHGMISAIGLLLVFFALLVRKCIARTEQKPCLYSGKTKLYPISLKKTVLHRLCSLSFRKTRTCRMR